MSSNISFVSTSQKNPNSKKNYKETSELGSLLRSSSTETKPSKLSTSITDNQTINSNSVRELDDANKQVISINSNDSAPKGWKERSAAAEDTGITPYFLDKAVKKILISTPALGYGLFASETNRKPARYYSPELLGEVKKLKFATPPENWVSLDGLSKEFGIPKKELLKILKSQQPISEELLYKEFLSVSGKFFVYCEPKVSEMLKEYIKTPDGWLSEKCACNKLGVSQRKLHELSTKLLKDKDEKWYLHKAMKHIYYNPRFIELAADYNAENVMKSNPNDISDNAVEWYPPKSYSGIISALEQKNKPDGYLCYTDLMHKLHISKRELGRSLNSVIEEHPELKHGWFITKQTIPSYCFEPEFLSALKARLIHTHIKPPDGWLKKLDIARELGLKATDKLFIARLYDCLDDSKVTVFILNDLHKTPYYEPSILNLMRNSLLNATTSKYTKARYSGKNLLTEDEILDSLKPESELLRKKIQKLITGKANEYAVKYNSDPSGKDRKKLRYDSKILLFIGRTLISEAVSHPENPDTLSVAFKTYINMAKLHVTLRGAKYFNENGTLSEKMKDSLNYIIRELSDVKDDKNDRVNMIASALATTALKTDDPVIVESSKNICISYLSTNTYAPGRKITPGLISHLYNSFIEPQKASFKLTDYIFAQLLADHASPELQKKLDMITSQYELERWSSAVVPY